VTEKQLYLLKFATSCAAELGASASQIMRCEAGNTNSLCVVLEHLPHNLLPQAFTSFPASASHRPENVALRNPRHRRPGIDRHLDPSGQWGRADPAVLTNEIHNAPATIALLNMSERKCRNLRPPEAAVPQKLLDASR
jgi:hypothetical protein